MGKEQDFGNNPVEIESKNPAESVRQYGFGEELESYVVRALAFGILTWEDLEDPIYVEAKMAEHRVACHEMGHAAATKGVVHLITIVPEGNSSGHTRVSVNGSSPMEKVWNMGKSLAGGLAAEQAMGQNDHRGCGSDLARLNWLADYASRFLYQGKISAGHFVSNAIQNAKRSLPSPSILRERAFSLQLKGTIV